MVGRDFTEMGKDESGNSINRVHRRKFLPSELLVCGECGGRSTVVGKGHYGCATRRAKDTCDNDWTITRPRIEVRVVLGGISLSVILEVEVFHYTDFPEGTRQVLCGGP